MGSHTPGTIRARYRLKNGDKVHFVDYGGVVAIVPVARNPLREAAGMLKGNASLVQSQLKSRKEDTGKG